MLEVGVVAVMVMLLEDDQAAKILSQLEPPELRLLGEKMCALGEIQPEIIAHAIANFVERTEKMGMVVHDRIGHVRSLMTRAVGDIKADNLMQRIQPEPPKAASLELARGQGVYLQRYKDGGLLDAIGFTREHGLQDQNNRGFPPGELKEWKGERAQAGRIAPRGWAKSGKFAAG